MADSFDPSAMDNVGTPADMSSDGQAGIGAAVGAGELGIGLATGNPIAIMGGIASLAGSALSFFGASSASKAQAAEAAVSKEVSENEMLINQQRASLAAQMWKRQSLENFRRTQIARANAIAAGVNQGAGSGAFASSGVKGGVAQTEAEGATNQANLDVNQYFSASIFGLTDTISKENIQLAGLGGSAASSLGLSQLGSSLAQAGPALTRITGGFGIPYAGQQL